MMACGSFVVDFQAFKSAGNDFILKELAIVGVDSNVVVQSRASGYFFL